MTKTKILVAPNSFKECIDSVALCGLISAFLKQNLTNIEIIELPVSDGGDGFLGTIQHRNPDISEKIYHLKEFSGRIITVPVLTKDRTLYIESASVIGLKLLPPKERNPLTINTSPLGELLHLINAENINRAIDIDSIVIGIGGTATNDLGFGMLSRFGLELLTQSGEVLEIIPSEYIKTSKIKWNKPPLSFNIKAVVDVNTPLTGKSGSAALFAGQKGASDNDIRLLEEGFENILGIIRGQGIYTGFELLSGAGGGLAAGLHIFLGAELNSSGQFIKEELGLDRIPEDISLVITGEGSFDLQSSLGKASGIILQYFNNCKRILICGTYHGDSTQSGTNLKIIELQKYFSSKDESIRRIYNGIEMACKEIISYIRKEV